MVDSSSRAAGYRIIDEPAPAALEQAIVNPIWPLFAAMFAGPWLAYPWFALNSFALGGFAAGAASLLLIAFLSSRLLLDERSLAYARLAPVGLRLAVFYWLFMRQEQTFGLYTYFGGQTRSAFLVVMAGAFLKGKLLGELAPFWQLLLG
jgi:hypothetical protein